MADQTNSNKTQQDDQLIQNNPREWSDEQIRLRVEPFTTSWMRDHHINDGFTGFTRDQLLSYGSDVFRQCGLAIYNAEKRATGELVQELVQGGVGETEKSQTQGGSGSVM